MSLQVASNFVLQIFDDHDLYNRVINLYGKDGVLDTLQLTMSQYEAASRLAQEEYGYHFTAQELRLAVHRYISEMGSYALLVVSFASSSNLTNSKMLSC